ncbi:MAG: exodeoxyribonuclease VII large subunit [Firmicutes bacterium]|nr:exodeoxyribonuclease VII large subunit [Bacillota bacterium]
MARKPVQVSQLNNYISRVLQTDPLLGNISVVGEISNLKYHGSGHVYFTLKDSRAAVRCFMPAGYASGLRYELADGMEVIASGYVSVYEKGGTYSLNVKDVEVSGEGGLMAAYRALYEKLQKAGWFDPARKRPIPVFPDTVCVITSETGAAVQDILNILRVRNPLVRVIVYPCQVQGEGAAAAIAEAIRHVNRRFPEVDVIITGRGGGSLEDLWAFNEEKTAAAILESRIPVISAVGHQTDFTIADFTADCRAETPTAAAVMAVPDVREFLRQMELMSPKAMAGTLRRQAEHRKWMTQQTALSLRQSMHRILERNRQEAEKCRIAIEAADPERIVQRGYAIVYDAEGRPVTGTGSVRAGETIAVHMRDGRLTAQVTAAELEREAGK